MEKLYRVPWPSAIAQGCQSQDEGCWPLKPDGKVVSLWSPVLHHRCEQPSQDNLRRQALSRVLQSEWHSRAEQAADRGEGRRAAGVSCLPCLSTLWTLVFLEGPRRADVKGCASVTSDPGMGHLFADRARAGSVPTASPALGLRLPTSFTASPSKDRLLPPCRWGASSQRQRSLMIKLCCWTPRPAPEAQLNS